MPQAPFQNNPTILDPLMRTPNDRGVSLRFHFHNSPAYITLFIKWLEQPPQPAQSNLRLTSALKIYRNLPHLVRKEPREPLGKVIPASPEWGTSPKRMGIEPQIVDREVIEDILKRRRGNEFGFRDVIQDAVRGRMFL